MRHGTLILMLVSWFVAGFISGGHALAWTPAGERHPDDPSHQHPAPGTSIVRFAQVDEGVYKGSRPKNDADFKFLQSIHIKTILELKFLPFLDRPEKRKAHRYGMALKTALMNASPFAPSEKHVIEIMRILRDDRLHPIYFHCDIGRDRTSLVAGLYEVYFRGKSPEEAWRDMTGFGFKESWTLRGLQRYFEKHSTRPPALNSDPGRQNARRATGTAAARPAGFIDFSYAPSP